MARSPAAAGIGMRAFAEQAALTGLCLLLSGCAAIPIPSYRFAEPTPAVAPGPTGTAAADPATGTPAEEATCDAAAEPALRTDRACGSVECPPLLTLPEVPCLCCWGGFGQHGAHGASGPLAPAEIPAPFGRFHPVPTRPVFAPRIDDPPPELMMQPLPHPHGSFHVPPRPLKLPADIRAHPLPAQTPAPALDLFDPPAERPTGG